MTSTAKRKQDPDTPPNLDFFRKKPRHDRDAVPGPGARAVVSTAALQGLLDFSSLNDVSDISHRFDQVADALLHGFRLVLKRGSVEAEYEILELEFYLQKGDCHEDPFTHGSEEQRVSGRWYFHRAPRRSADSHRSQTSTTGYRGGTRKGMDLTVGGPASSPYFSPKPAAASEPLLLRGGALLRTVRRSSDAKVISGPSLLVDHVLQASGATGIADLVENIWGGDTAAFPLASPRASLSLRPVGPSGGTPPSVYRSPRIGLDLSHPGTTTSPAHPRIVFLSKRYRYFVRPDTLTANGRTQTFLGVLWACVDTGRYGDGSDSAALRRELVKITGLKEPTVARYLAEYGAGVSGGSLKSFVGPSGKGASASPSTYLRMMGTLERIRRDAGGSGSGEGGAGAEEELVKGMLVEPEKAVGYV